MADSDDPFVAHTAMMKAMAPASALFAEHAAMAAEMTRPPEKLGPIKAGERDELLRDAFTDEALRRMERKASVETVAQKGSLKVNEELRSLGELLMNNVYFFMVEVKRS